MVYTERDVINRLHKLVPAGGVCEPTRKTKGGKQTYSWPLQNTNAALDLLVVVFPLMREKTEQDQGNLESPYFRAVPER